MTFKADGGAGNCSTTGATITNTGTVASLSNAVVCAVVTVPAGYAAGSNDLYFRALSPNSAATDTIHDAVTVNATRSLTFTPNHSGQVAPGGSFVYTQTLTNTGNVTEGNGTVSSIAFTSANNQAGWTSHALLRRRRRQHAWTRATRRSPAISTRSPVSARVWRPDSRSPSSSR